MLSLAVLIILVSLTLVGFYVLKELVVAQVVYSMKCL
jgi:hypothetical protein